MVLWFWLLIGVVWSSDNQVDEVHRLQRQGQYVEAGVILRGMILDTDSVDVQFEWARNLELQGKYEAAALVYDDLYKHRFKGDFGLNVAYRRALVLSNIGRHNEALRTLRRMRWRKLRPTDRRAILLALGAAEIMAGKNRKGMLRVEKALASLETPTEWSWLQARARMAICKELLHLAQNTELLLDENLNAAMDVRANWILTAERHIRMIVQLQEPDYVLQSIESLADALVLFHDDLVSLPPPVELTTTQQALLEERLAQHSEMLLEKALGYYQLADRFGSDLDWAGPELKRIQSKKQILQEEM